MRRIDVMRAAIAALACFALGQGAALSQSAPTLTGAWTGSYEQQGAETAFSANLVERAGVLSGDITETRDVAGQQTALHARVAGFVKDGRVQFTKTYDGTAGWSHQVGYTGGLDDARATLSGRWRVVGADVEGGFTMARR